MSENSSPGNLRGNLGDRNLLHLGLVIIFGIAATTLPQPQALGRLPLQFLLKNEVSVTREQMAAFFFWCGLAWYLKPFAGILTDAFPLFRTRRRHYLLFSSVLACVSWYPTFAPCFKGLSGVCWLLADLCGQRAQMRLSRYPSFQLHTFS